MLYHRHHHHPMDIAAADGDNKKADVTKQYCISFCTVSAPALLLCSRIYTSARISRSIDLISLERKGE
jgi:hypothetical protein